MEALCFQVIHLSVCDLAIFIAGCSFVCFADTAALAQLYRFLLLTY